MSVAYPALVTDVVRDPHQAIKHAFYSSAASARTGADLTRLEIFEMGFRRGAQWSARLSGQLSPHLAALADFLIWLNQPQEQDDWDTFVEVPPVEYVGSTNGTGEADSPW